MVPACFGWTLFFSNLGIFIIFLFPFNELLALADLLEDSRFHLSYIPLY